jgi:hypothetical protein
MPHLYFHILKVLGNILRDVTLSWNIDHESGGVRHGNFLEETTSIAGY